MTTYNFYTIRELAPQQHECTPDMHFGYNAGRVKNRIYLPDTFIGATYYFDGEYSNRYGTSQIDDEGRPYIDINFNNGEIGNGTVFIIAGKRYCTFQYTLEYVNVHETEIDASEIDTSNLVTKQTFDNTVERIDNDITTGDTANRTAIDQLTAATNQRFADVNTKLSGYDEEIGAVDTEVKNLASEVDGYSTDIAKAVADAADAKSVAEGAADDAATARAEAGEAKDAVSNLGIRVTQVETDVETAETVANQAKSAADAAAQTAGSAQSTASAAQSAAGAAQISADVAKTAADNAQSTADEAKQAAQTNAGEITTIKGQVSAIQQKDTEQDGKISMLESTTAGTAETVNTLQENFNNLNDSVGNLGTAVQANIQDISSLETKVAEVETTANNALPKTGGEITGTLKIVGGIKPVELGSFTDMDNAGWTAIQDWYNGLPVVTSALALIVNNQGDSHGLGGGYTFLCAYKTDNQYGVIEAVTYFSPYKRYCVISDSVFSDFSASITASASYIKSRQTWTGNVKPEGDPYSIPASVLSLFINIAGSSYSEGETITFEFYANTTDESPSMKIPCRVLSTDISNLDVLIDFAAGTFAIYETDISQTPAKQLTKKLANGFNIMRPYPSGYKKINVKTSATHEKPNTMYMIVRSLY